MRALKKNKQKMYYSQKTGWQEQYELDEDGNIKYIEIDGEQVPVTTGEKKLSYGLPIEFYANINGKLNDAIVRAFGVDNSDNHAQIVANKDEFPFVIGTRIWLHTEVSYIDKDKTIVNQDTADYEVRGVLKEALNEDMFYLVVLNHEESVSVIED